MLTFYKTAELDAPDVFEKTCVFITPLAIFRI